MKKASQMIGVQILALLIGISSTVSSVVYAEGKNAQYKKIYNTSLGVEVSVKADLDVDEDFLTGFLMGIPADDRDRVQIEEVGGNDLGLYPKRTPFYNMPIIEPFPASYFYTVHFTNRNFKTNETFLTSVAKGMKTTLRSAITVSDHANITASVESNYLNFVKARVEADYGTGFSHTVDTQYEFTGPPESSNYNSRSYYMAIVNDLGYYKVWRWRNDKKIVNFRAPKNYVIYSIDSLIR